MATFSDFNDFDESYFRAGDFEEPPDGAYHGYSSENGAGTVDYDSFITQLDTLTGSSPTVLIAGCGTGVTVKGMRNQASTIDDAFGIDISQWAIDNHAAGIAQDIMQADIRSTTDMDAAQANWNINQAWDVIYTEFLLSHYDDTDARAIHQNAIDYVSHGGRQRGTVVHRIWSGQDSGIFNVKTVAEWQSLMSDIDPDGVTVEWIDYDNPEDSTI